VLSDQSSKWFDNSFSAKAVSKVHSNLNSDKCTFELKHKQ